MIILAFLVGLFCWFWFCGWLTVFIHFKMYSITGNWYFWSVGENPFTYAIYGLVVNLIIGGIASLIFNTLP